MWHATCRALLALALCCAPVVRADQTVRVAIVGGPVLAGVWPRLVERAQQATHLHISTVMAAPKDGVVPAFARGDADLLLIHGSDEAFFLAGHGLSGPLRPWALNGFAIVGPHDDPAGVRQATDGTDAMRRIAAADAPLLAFRDPGSFTITQRLWKRAGIRPGARQQWPDESAKPQQVLVTAAQQGAYAIVGYIPVRFGRIPDAGLDVLLHGDPLMQRMYVILEPGPRHPASRVQRQRAARLAQYLVSAAGQAALVQADQDADGPWLHPLSQTPDLYPSGE